MTNHTEAKAAIKDYIMAELLPGEDPDELDDATPLITGGILDSISTVQLVSFLEGRFGVEFQAHEMNADYLGSIARIAQTVETKQGGARPR